MCDGRSGNWPVCVERRIWSAPESFPWIYSTQMMWMNVCNVVRPHSGCCITASNLYGNEEITECHYNVAMAGSSPFIPIIHHVIRRATLAAIEKTKMLNGDFTVSDSQFLCFLFVFFFVWYLQLLLFQTISFSCATGSNKKHLSMFKWAYGLFCRRQWYCATAITSKDSIMVESYSVFGYVVCRQAEGRPVSECREWKKVATRSSSECSRIIFEWRRRPDIQKYHISWQWQSAFMFLCSFSLSLHMQFNSNQILIFLFNAFSLLRLIFCLQICWLPPPSKAHFDMSILVVECKWNSNAIFMLISCWIR